jgi:hypothetical protein
MIQEVLAPIPWFYNEGINTVLIQVGNNALNLPTHSTDISLT